MSSKQSRHKRSNKKSLNRGPTSKHLFICLALGAFVIGFFLLGENPEEQQQSQKSSEKNRLKALPYLSWIPTNDASKSGVTKFDQGKSLTGINIYKSGDTPEAYLMDMGGKILHTWTHKPEENITWSNIELSSQGDLYVFVDYEKLVKLDWNSNLLWQSDNLGFHHDLSFSEDNDIYALARKVEYIPELNLTHLTANDYITILSETGTLKKSISIATLLLNADIAIVHDDIEADYPRDTELKAFIARIEDGSIYSFFIPLLRKAEQIYEKLSRPKDFLHTNTINIVRNKTPGSNHELFKNGNILICIRNQNLVAIVDIEKEEIVWSWGTEELEHPHDPLILNNGNMLIFDNGYKRNYSRIIELNPVSREIVWEYKSIPPEKFYSETRGSIQQLINGNILIADSRNGHAFEITRDGETVWEFFNPEIKTENKEAQRATIFRMRRLTNLKIPPY
ncbi:MAG TPA: arylsulfotransferase family protein [Gammaproteobacteria bacterium]|jgi:hypothetical protein|nr:hypothetical protein [Gammaproteobacteria bacterium]HJP39352.1 arylsulfotransferase family protein [Gammaproteobacteria bacterium]